MKKYRGMGSIEAMKKGSDDRYFTNMKVNEKIATKVRVAQGVTGTVVDKGSLKRYLPYLISGVKHGFQDLGIKNVKCIAEKKNKTKEIRFEIRSPAAQREGGVHSLYSFTKTTGY